MWFEIHFLQISNYVFFTPTKYILEENYVPDLATSHPHPLPICPVLIAAVGIREISSTEESESKIVSKCTALNSYLQHVESYSLPMQ